MEAGQLSRQHHQGSEAREGAAYMAAGVRAAPGAFALGWGAHGAEWLCGA